MAALISQNTNLKSLRYGKDRAGGGESNQPYIKSPIPENRNQLGRNGGIDFLLRGGTLTPSRAAEDVSRLTKMFADFKSPNGVLFAAKQNILSLSGVKTQASGIINQGIYTPAATILQAGGNAFGVHLNKQGLNPLRNTSPSEGGLGRLFEFTGPLGLPTYAQTVKPDQETVDNRLFQLKNSKLNSPFIDPAITRGQEINAIGEARALRQIARANNTIDQFRDDRRKSRQSARADEKSQNNLNISKFSNEILKYGGGPNSLLGVGQTTIRRYSNTADGLDFVKNPNFEGKYFVLSSNEIDNKPTSKDNTQISDFRRDLLSKQDTSKKNKNILSISPDYSINGGKNRIENRYRLGDPGRRNKNITNYVSGSLVDGKYLPLDVITSQPLYKSNKAFELDDLVNFRIGVIDNTRPSEKVYIHFRAFLDSMDDNYNAEWNSFKYMGRGENFYRYNGFARTINLSWTVAAQSKQELIPMYQKLNFLASSLAPDFSTNGYMRGNLATLTVGGYLHEQPGIITSINYSVPQESPWEIGIDNIGISEGNKGMDKSVNQLPHIIKVTGFQFIPIHTFVPKLQQNKYLEDGDISVFGNERYISLKHEDETNNYSPTNFLPPWKIIPEPTIALEQDLPASQQ